MRMLRGLSVGKKLAISAGVTVLLVLMLVASVTIELNRQAGLAAQADAAASAHNTINQAWIAASLMRGDGQSLLRAQDGKALAASLDGIARHRQTATEQLGQVRANASIAQRDKLDAAVAKVSALADALSQSGTMRRTLIDARDSDFMGAQDHFLELANTAANRGRDLPDEQRDDVGKTLATYQLAIADLRTKILRYLATGDSSVKTSVPPAATAAATVADLLREADVPPEMRQALDEMVATGGQLSFAANELFKATAALDEQTEKTIEPLASAVADTMAAAGDVYTQAAAQAVHDADQGRTATLQRLHLLAGTVVLLVALSGLLTIRSIARPLRHITDVIQRMADGDTSVQVGLTQRRDEIGRVAAALEALRSVVRLAFVQGQMIEQMPLGIITASGGQITYANTAIRAQIGVARPDVEQAGLIGLSLVSLTGSTLDSSCRMSLGEEAYEIGVSHLRDRDGHEDSFLLVWRCVTEQARLAEGFEQSVGGIARQVGEAAVGMRETAQAMASIATDAGARAEQVRLSSRGASTDVHSVVDTIEHMRTSVSEIARQVAESARMSAQAVAEAQEADRVIGELNGAAGAIGTVVTLIREIAQRTNLLALNATIEAARAGEAGRGFAVVAGEVKTLASQTAKATGEIGGHIAGMQTQTGQAVLALRSIGATITQLDSIAATVAAVVQQQEAATREIAQAVSNAARGTAGVDDTIAEVGDAVAQTQARSGEVLEAANLMGGQAGKLRDEVDAFLQRITASR
jgi:methyl-accepting chemotaxis protein